MRRKAFWVAGISVALLLLLRKKSPAAAAAAAPSSGFLPLGLATIYFDPGQTYDVNANVNSPAFGNEIN